MRLLLDTQAGRDLLCEGLFRAHAVAGAAADVAAQGVSLAHAVAGGAAEGAVQGVSLAYVSAGAVAGICQGLLRVPSLLLQPVC